MLHNLLDNDGINRLVHMRDGWMLYNKNDQYVGASIEHYGEFSYEEMQLFLQIVTEGSYIIEVGANIGAHTLGLSKQIGSTGKLYAYEPQRIVFQNLCANMSLNACLNVYCFEQAVSNAKSHITLPEIDYAKQGNFGGIAIEEFTTGHPVQVVVLDEALADIPRLDLIKVDVEGMESKVLGGARTLINKHHPMLYVENDRLEKSQALIELIQALDYRLFWHIAPLYNPQNYAGNPVNIFGKVGSYNMLCFHKSLEINCSGFIEIQDSCLHPLQK